MRQLHCCRPLNSLNTIPTHLVINAAIEKKNFGHGLLGASGFATLLYPKSPTLLPFFGEGII